jgi:hypothetical protein
MLLYPFSVICQIWKSQVRQHIIDEVKLSLLEDNFNFYVHAMVVFIFPFISHMKNLRKYCLHLTIESLYTSPGLSRGFAINLFGPVKVAPLYREKIPNFMLGCGNGETLEHCINELDFRLLCRCPCSILCIKHIEAPCYGELSGQQFYHCSLCKYSHSLPC